MKKWSPSLEQLESYVTLLRERNKVRRQILRKRAKVEKLKAKGVTVPDLVVPKYVRVRQNIRTYRFKGWKDYQTKMRELRRVYGKGIETYYKETYKKNILSAYRDMITTAVQENGYESDFGKPQGRGGYYSREQIEQAGELGDYMELYNRFVAMNPSKFQDMYENGYITPLKYMYVEMISGKQNSISFLDEQTSMFDIYNHRTR